MIKDTRYIIKRVIIGVLISLILSFIYACDVKAENQIISPSNLTLVKVYGSTNTTISDKNCNNNTCFWNSSGNATSFRWNAQSTLSYGNLDLVVFNMSLWQQTGSEEWPISEVAFGNSECFYIRNDNPIYDDGANAASTINISALCPIGDTVSLSSGSKTVNFTLNNTGGQGNFFKLALSNITLTKDNKMVEMLNYLSTLNTAINTLNSNMNVVKQDLTYLLQAQNNTSYWAEVNSGKLEAIKTLLTNQTTAIVAAQQQTTTAVNQTNDTIKDDNVDDPSSSLNNMDSKIATNSVISDLLLLPVSLFQKVINSINGACSTFNLGSLLGTNLTLPCINLSNILGSALYGVIDVLLCGIFVLSMRKRFVNIFENITSLKDRGNELE